MGEDELINIIEALQKSIEKEFPNNDYEIKLVKSKTNNNHLPDSFFEEGILKENAWIVFTQDKEGLLTDLQVYELDKNYPIKWDKTVDYVTRKCKERKISFCDIGCVSGTWNKWNLEDILFKLFINYGCKDRETRLKILRSLQTIKEFEDKIESWLCSLY
jgi:hypothetical protein